MNRNMRRTGLAALVVAMAITGPQVVTAAPAAAVAGLTRVLGDATPDNDEGNKSAVVTCPSAAPRVVGGGIVIEDHGRRQGFAQVSRPVPGMGPNGEDGWRVAAALPPGLVEATYSLRAVAVCARTAGVPGHQVVNGPPVQVEPGAVTQEAAAVCPAGKRVVGVGGTVTGGGRGIGLNLVRASGPRDISRAFARDRFGEAGDVWQVRAHAVCMTTTDSREPVVAAVPGPTAAVLCTDSNLSVHGPGGGAFNGLGLIHRIEPSSSLEHTTVITTPGSRATFVSTICLP